MSSILEPDGVPRRRPPQRVLILVNPAAGQVTDDLVEQLTAACREHLKHVSVVRSEHRGAAVDLTAAAVATGRTDREPIDAVLAVGGDATCREVAEGLARAAGRWRGTATDRRGPALLLIPGGRGNSAYHAIWGDAPWQDVLRAALSGDGARVRELDLLRVADTDHASLLGLNAGLLARIVRLAANEPASGTALERYGAVMGPVLEQFEPFQGRVTVDGTCVVDGSITQVTVGGLRRWAGGVLEILPRSVLDDGLLDVCAIGEMTAGGFTEVAPLLMTGAHVDLPNVTYAQGRCVVLERDDGRPLELEFDGDAWPGAGSSITLEMRAGAVPTFTALDPPPDAGDTGAVALYARTAGSVRVRDPAP
jgi:diacylglycerol kinase (ATP)